MPIVEMCLGNRFYLQHGIFSLCLCCKTRGKVVSIQMKWRYEKVEKVVMAACVVGHVKDCVRRSLAKAMLPLEELNFGVTVRFVCLVFLGRRVCIVSIKVAQR